MNRSLYKALKNLMREEGYNNNFSAFVCELGRGALRRSRQEGTGPDPTNTQEATQQPFKQNGQENLPSPQLNSTKRVSAEENTRISTGPDQNPAMPQKQNPAVPPTEMKSKAKRWTPDHSSPWLTRAEAADYLRWSVRTVDRYLVPMAGGRITGKIRHEVQNLENTVRIRLLAQDVYAICPLPRDDAPEPGR
jgi:hypothetical protein